MGELELSQKDIHEKPEHQKISSNSKPPGKYKAKPHELTNAPLQSCNENKGNIKWWRICKRFYSS